MSNKDNWDKFEIAIKFIGSVVLVAIPIVIKYSADSISQSMQRGQLIQSLTTELVQKDARRDIALIALDAAIPEKKKCTILWIWGCQNDLEPKNLEEDQVLAIAEVLVNRSIKDYKKQVQNIDLAEIEVAKQIIIRRTDEEYYKKKYREEVELLAQEDRQTSKKDVETKPTQQEIASKTQSSNFLQAIQPQQTQSNGSNLAGIRIVYIQYDTDKELAERIQKKLQDKGILAPGIEKISGIKNNDIRYANAADKDIAENLKKYIEEKEQQIKFDKLIDLSDKGYTVSSGQFEIWLK